MNKIKGLSMNLYKFDDDYKMVINKIIVGLNNLSQCEPPIVLSAFPTEDKWHCVETIRGQVGIFVWSMPENFADWNAIVSKLNKKGYEKIIHISINSFGKESISGTTLSPNDKITLVILNSEEDIEKFSIENYLR